MNRKEELGKFRGGKNPSAGENGQWAVQAMTSVVEPPKEENQTTEAPPQKAGIKMEDKKEKKKKQKADYSFK